MRLTQKRIRKFQDTISAYYHDHGRDLPWRRTRDPYFILVSEIMLQQTQTERVIPKYNNWLTAFPTIESLAQASLPQVLTAWQGLGYNRRGLALKRLAEEVVTNYRGRIPDTSEALCLLPGIGPYTANAILAFVHQKPVVMIETNIRRVFIHHFFPDQEHIRDADLMPLIEKCLDTTNPREWYYALMDYGAMLGKSLSANPNKNSQHYNRQSAFEGSHRQLRSKVLKLLLEHQTMTQKTLAEYCEADQRLATVITALEKEGFIHQTGNKITLSAK